MSEWYHARDGRQQGPFDLEHVRRLVREGSLGEDDLAWRQGLPDWLPVRQIPELAADAVVAGPTPTVAPPDANPYSTPTSLAAAADAPARRLDLSRVLSTGWSAFRISIGFGLLCLLALVVVTVAAAILDLALEVQVFGYAVGILAGTHLQAGALLGAIHACRGQAPEAGTLFQPFRTSYLPLMAVALVTNLLMLGGILLGGLLLAGGALAEVDPLLLVGPALLAVALWAWVWVRVYLIVPAIVDRRLGPIAGLIASWRMTRGNVLMLILLFLICMLVMLGGMLLLVVGMIPAAWLITCYAAAAYDQLSSQS